MVPSLKEILSETQIKALKWFKKGNSPYAWEMYNIPFRGPTIKHLILNNFIYLDSEDRWVYNPDSEKVLNIDPPDGWRFGFPKKIHKNLLKVKNFKTVLIDLGYPEEKIDDTVLNYCRFWGEPDDK